MQSNRSMSRIPHSPASSQPRHGHTRNPPQSIPPIHWDRAFCRCCRSTLASYLHITDRTSRNARRIGRGAGGGRRQRASTRVSWRWCQAGSRCGERRAAQRPQFFAGSAAGTVTSTPTSRGRPNALAAVVPCAHVRCGVGVARGDRGHHWCRRGGRWRGSERNLVAKEGR